MANEKVQLKQETIVGNDVVLDDIFPNTNTRSVNDPTSGEQLDQTLARIWNTINNKLSRIVNSVNGRTGVVVLTSEDVGLGNVDNVSFSDIKDWIINRLLNEFNHKRLKLVNNLIEMQEYIVNNDDSKRDTSFFSDNGYDTDKKQYIGYTYWDEETQTLKLEYLSLKTIGYTDNTIVYDEKVNENDLTGGGIGVNLWIEDNCIKVQNGATKEKSGLYIDKMKVHQTIHYFGQAYGEHPELDGQLSTDRRFMLWNKNQFGLDGSTWGEAGESMLYLNVDLSDSNGKFGDVIFEPSSFRLNPYYKYKLHDIIIINFGYNKNYFQNTVDENDTIIGRELLKKEIDGKIYAVHPAFVGRSPMIGFVTGVPYEVDHIYGSGKGYNIEFYTLAPQVSYGIGNIPTHQARDGDAAGASFHDRVIGIKTAKGEYDNNREPVNVSGLLAYANPAVHPREIFNRLTGTWTYNVPERFRYINTPLGPKRVLETSTPESNGLYISSDASLMISPTKFFGPKGLNRSHWDGRPLPEEEASFQYSKSIIHPILDSTNTGYERNEDGSYKLYKEDIDYDAPYRSRAVSNWCIPYASDLDRVYEDGSDSSESDGSSIGINLMKIMNRSSIDVTQLTPSFQPINDNNLQFANISGLRINQAYNNIDKLYDYTGKFENNKFYVKNEEDEYVEIKTYPNLIYLDENTGIRYTAVSYASNAATVSLVEIDNRKELQLTASFFGKTPAELLTPEAMIDNNKVEDANKFLLDQYTSGGISVNVGKFLEISTPSSYVSHNEDFYNTGKINVRIGRGLRENYVEDGTIQIENQTIPNTMLNGYNNTNGGNRIELAVSEDNILNFTEDGGVFVNVSPDLGLTTARIATKNNLNTLGVKISDPLSQSQKNDEDDYVASTSNYYGGLRFTDGYLAIRINNDTVFKGGNANLRNGSRGLSIDDNNILGINLAKYTSGLKFDEYGALSIDESKTRKIGLMILNNDEQTCFAYNPNRKGSPAAYSKIKLGAGLKLVGGVPVSEISIDDPDATLRNEILDKLDNIDINDINTLASNHPAKYSMEIPERVMSNSVFDQYKEALEESDFIEIAAKSGANVGHIVFLIVADMVLNEFRNIPNNQMVENLTKNDVLKHIFMDDETLDDQLRTLSSLLLDSHPELTCTEAQYNTYLKNVFNELFPSITYKEATWIGGLTFTTRRPDESHRFIAYYIAAFLNPQEMNAVESTPDKDSSEERLNAYNETIDYYAKWMGTFVDCYNWIANIECDVLDKTSYPYKFPTGYYIDINSTSTIQLKSILNQIRNDVETFGPDELEEMSTLINSSTKIFVQPNFVYLTSMDGVDTNVSKAFDFNDFESLSLNSLLKITNEAILSMNHDSLLTWLNYRNATMLEFNDDDARKNDIINYLNGTGTYSEVGYADFRNIWVHYKLAKSYLEVNSNLEATCKRFVSNNSKYLSVYGLIRATHYYKPNRYNMWSRVKSFRSFITSDLFLNNKTPEEIAVWYAIFFGSSVDNYVMYDTDGTKTTLAPKDVTDPVLYLLTIDEFFETLEIIINNITDYSTIIEIMSTDHIKEHGYVPVETSDTITEEEAIRQNLIMIREYYLYGDCTILNATKLYRAFIDKAPEDRRFEPMSESAQNYWENLGLFESDLDPESPTYGTGNIRRAACRVIIALINAFGGVNNVEVGVNKVINTSDGVLKNYSMSVTNSGLMTAIINYMGYTVDMNGSSILDGGKLMEVTSNTFIKDKNGNISNKWIAKKYTKETTSRPIGLGYIIRFNMKDYNDKDVAVYGLDVAEKLSENGKSVNEVWGFTIRNKADLQKIYNAAIDYNEDEAILSTTNLVLLMDKTIIDRKDDCVVLYYSNDKKDGETS